MSSTALTAKVKARAQKKPKNVARRLILLVLAVYLGLVVYRTAHAMIIVRLADAEPVPYGLVYSSLPVSGLLVRTETAYAAPRSGKLKIVVPEGERVRVGETVAQVVTPSLDSKTGEAYFDIRAREAGAVSYYLDGLEGVLTPDHLDELNLEKLVIPTEPPVQIKAGGSVAQGQPVLKIVNNLEPLFVIADMGQQPKPPELTKISTLPVVLSEGDANWAEADLLNPAFRDRSDRMLLRFQFYQGTLISQRTRVFQLITERMEGYHIPAGAVVRKDGQDGILTMYKERVRWQKIEVKGQLNGQAVISGITPNTKVIFNPSYVKEGDPFR